MHATVPQNAVCEPVVRCRRFLGSPKARLPAQNRKLLLHVFIVVVLWYVGRPQPAAAAVFNIPAGDVPALIHAIEQSNAMPDADTIILAAGVYILTAVHNSSLDGANGLPIITSPIEMIGVSPDVSVIQRSLSAAPFRILSVAPTGTLVLKKIEVSRGNTCPPGSVGPFRCFLGADGGGISNAGSTELINCVIAENGAANGGGIDNRGTMTVIGTSIFINVALFSSGGGLSNNGRISVIDSSFESNHAQFNGGAIFSEGELSLINSTLTRNVAERSGSIESFGEMAMLNTTVSGNSNASGGSLFAGNSTIINSTISHNSGGLSTDSRPQFRDTVNIKNTIFANNTDGNCVFPILSLGHNLDSDGTCNLTGPGDLSGIDPALGPLQNNGGPIETHALLPGSPAIDAGDPNDAWCVQSDARGILRPQDGNGDGVNRCDIGALEFGSAKLQKGARSLIGDKDNLHEGDPVDVPPRSPRGLELERFISADSAQFAGVYLDVIGENRPVGLTHFVALPPGARMTSAIVKVRVLEGDLGNNDVVYYDESASLSETDFECFVEGLANCPNRKPIFPAIAIRDLLGREPARNEVLDLQINLAKVPVRTKDMTGALQGSWSAAPDEYRSLLPQLLDGAWNMVFSDDAAVDWSELTLTFVLPGAPLGDLTGDNLVDRNDLNMILGALNTPAYSSDDPRDLDHDGKITVLDARKLALACSKPGCAP